jgi:hypothetical protein
MNYAMAALIVITVIGVIALIIMIALAIKERVDYRRARRRQARLIHNINRWINARNELNEALNQIFTRHKLK